MNGRLALGAHTVAQYDTMTLRIEQREDHLHITVYDSKSTRPNNPVWEGQSHDIEDAIDTAIHAARGYLADPEIPSLVWSEVATHTHGA
jgi:hypothetical protein